MEKRIKYLDGIKLIACYLIMLAHYCMAYLPNGYIGYGSAYTEAEKVPAFIENLPQSLFTNTSLELYVFFALIAVIATVAFYQAKNPQNFLEKQAIKRYFRFLIPVACAILLTYGLNRANLLHYDDIYNLSGSAWNLAMKPIDVAWWEALYIACVQCFFVPSTGILPTLWCMDIIFIGSLLTYCFLAVMGNSKKRYAVYVIGTLFFIPFPKYFVFFVGIMCGDFLVHGLEYLRLTRTKREGLAFGMLLLGIAVGIIPSIFVAPPITLEYTYSIGTGLILIGLMLSGVMQKILSAKILISQSKYTFSLLLVQIPIMYGISGFVFNFIYAFNQQYLISFWIMFVVCAAISHIAAIGFHFLFEQPSAKLADFIFNKRSI